MSDDLQEALETAAELLDIPEEGWTREPEASKPDEEDEQEKDEQEKDEQEVEAPPKAEDDFPKSWKQEIREHWGTLPPAVREEVRRREEDFFKGLEGYKSAAQRGKAFDDALAPHRDVFEQYGVDPVGFVRDLAMAHRVLSLGSPEQKTAAFKQLMTQYGVNLEAPPADELTSRLHKVESQLEANSRAAAESQLRQTQEYVTRFAQDKPDFSAVAEDVARLLRADSKLTLEKAYDQARRLNPDSFEAILSAERDKARKEVEEAAAARAKASRVNVQSRDSEATPTGATGTFEDTMAQVYDNLMRR